jgi:hypothetical protein
MNCVSKYFERKEGEKRESEADGDLEVYTRKREESECTHERKTAPIWYIREDTTLKDRRYRKMLPYTWGAKWQEVQWMCEGQHLQQGSYVEKITSKNIMGWRAKRYITKGKRKRVKAERNQEIRDDHIFPIEYDNSKCRVKPGSKRERNWSETKPDQENEK